MVDGPICSTRSSTSGWRCAPSSRRTCHSSAVPPSGRDRRGSVPPSFVARSVRLRRPLPGRERDRHPATVVEHAEVHHLVAGDEDLHARRPGVLGDVRQRLAQAREQLLGDPRVHRVDGSVEADTRLEAQGGTLVVHDAQHLRPHTATVASVGLEAEDDRTDLPDRVVEIVDDAGEAAPVFGIRGARGHALDGHPRGEELLDDDVVQVAGDALTVFDHTEVLLGLAAAVPPSRSVRVRHARSSHSAPGCRRRPGWPASGSRPGDRSRPRWRCTVVKVIDNCSPRASGPRSSRNCRSVNSGAMCSIVICRSSSRRVPDLLGGALVGVGEPERVGVQHEDRITGRVECVAYLPLLGFCDPAFGHVARRPRRPGVRRRSAADSS